MNTTLRWIIICVIVALIIFIAFIIIGVASVDLQKPMDIGRLMEVIK